MEGFGAKGLPGCRDEGASGSPRRVGERKGEEKERRYKAMKNSSFMAQKVKRTAYTS
jgi:hypothetical protein